MKFSYRLPAVLVGAAIAIAQLQTAFASSTDKVEEVKAIAEEITVLIPEKDPNSGKTANGSGFLIAKQGNTYTVLTANHVVCKDNLDRCQQPRPGLKVVTHDGQEYPLDFKTVKKLPGLDLAVLQFNSDRNYQLATLANYDTGINSEREVRLANGDVVREYGHFVFASGWPGINDRDITELNYRFSVGRLLPPNRIVGFQIRPVAEGYEAVYTSITYPGMSGGPVLDTDGRAIAVHGQNEGERVYNESASGQERVQIGYSLSIPIAKFLNQASQAGISLTNVRVENHLPPELNEDDLDAIGTEYLWGWIQEQNSADTKSAVYWANLGNQYWRACNMDDALDAYNKALEIDPDFYPVWYGKGLVKNFFGQYDEAFANYSKAIEILDKKIAEFPRDNKWQEIKGWVVKLQNKIQPLVKNPQTRQPSTADSANPESQPSPTTNPPAPVPQPSPTVQPTTPNPQPSPDPGLLW